MFCHVLTNNNEGKAHKNHIRFVTYAFQDLLLCSSTVLFSLGSTKVSSHRWILSLFVLRNSVNFFSSLVLCHLLVCQTPAASASLYNEINSEYIYSRKLLHMHEQFF